MTAVAREALGRGYRDMDAASWRRLCAHPPRRWLARSPKRRRHDMAPGACRAARATSATHLGRHHSMTATFSDLAGAIAELPDRKAWRDGFASLRAELRSLIRPRRRRYQLAPRAEATEARVNERLMNVPPFQ